MSDDGGERAGGDTGVEDMDTSTAPAPTTTAPAPSATVPVPGATATAPTPAPVDVTMDDVSLKHISEAATNALKERMKLSKERVYNS